MSRFERRLIRGLDEIAERATPSPSALADFRIRVAEQTPHEEVVIMMTPDNIPPRRPRRVVLAVVGATAAVVLALAGIILLQSDGDEVVTTTDTEPSATAPDDMTVPTDTVVEDGDDASRVEATEITVDTQEADESTWLDDPGVLDEWEFFDGTERAALVSEWADDHRLLTGDEVLAALGDPTLELWDAESSVTAEGKFTFLVPKEQVPGVVIDVAVSYVLQRDGEGESGPLIYVSEYVAHGPAVAKAYVEGEQHGDPSERRDPPSVGVAAVAYVEFLSAVEALGHWVAVDTGEALMVINSDPRGYVDYDDGLSRDQIDDVVEAAVEKLG